MEWARRGRSSACARSTGPTAGSAAACPVNYHTLSDFRVDHGTALDELLTQTLAVLMERKLITLQRVAQDGLRVRASAGAGSFRRKKKLRAYLKEARAQVNAVKQLAEDPALNAREKAARARAAREREERVKAALGALKDVEAKRRVRVHRRAQGQRGAARLDDRSRGAQDAHGQRAASVRGTRPVRHRRAERHHRRGARDQQRQRQRASAADDRADRAAHRAQAEGLPGGCRLHRQGECGCARCEWT